MNADEFVAEVLRIEEESVAAWHNQGLSEDVIDVLRMTFGIKRVNWRHELVNNPVWDIIYCFEKEMFCIGQVHFDNAVRDYGEFYGVGTCDVDIVGISKDSGEVAVYEYSHIDHVISRCASNENTFLDASLYFLGTLMCEPSDDERCRYAADLAAISGGDQYLDFWKMIAMCDS